MSVGSERVIESSSSSNETANEKTELVAFEPDPDETCCGRVAQFLEALLRILFPCCFPHSEDNVTATPDKSAAAVASSKEVDDVASCPAAITAAEECCQVKLLTDSYDIISALDYRSEEPVNANMDISTGHTILVRANLPTAQFCHCR